MATDRWRRLEVLYHDMLSRPPSERAAALVAACTGDAALQADVQSLLDQSESMAGFLATPALDVAAQLVSSPGLQLTGLRLGVFELQDLIGAGGMGEVYRARDTRLGREVAIKILPRVFKDDPDRLARFEREARMLASLNHPHIAAIHGLEEADGVTALVMELVEGEDLSQRIARGAIPVDEALPIAKQIAEALEAAHERGIIHRDLKPANIMVRRDGVVKILDFGLAKALSPGSEATPALTAIPTHTGAVIAIMGTPAYMSPEQARGGVVSRQSDIWSFGVVLFELLTAASPFGRPTTTETLASVLDAQPDYTALPTATPTPLRHLLRRCLEKDQTRRWQHMGDVRIEIEEAMAGPPVDTPPGRRDSTAAHGPRPRDAATTALALRGRLRVAGTIMLAVLTGIAGWWLAPHAAMPTPAAVVRLSIPSLEPPSPVAGFGFRRVAISADGSRVAYVSANRLWIRRIDRKETVAIDVTSSTNPFFSPDGESVGFFASGLLRRVPAIGGTPIDVVATSDRSGGGTWRSDGTIVFATNEGLFQVPGNGGAARLLVKPDRGRKERAYAWPHFMPDGRSVLFTIVPDDPIDAAQIAVLDLQTLHASIVLKGGSAARYVSTKHLVYTSGQTLNAIAFNPDTRQTRGDPVSLPDIEIATTPDNGAAQFAVSDAGTLIFLTPDMFADRGQRLWWVDRHGKAEPLALPPDQYRYPRVSPDGMRVALDISGANRDIWMWNLERHSLTRLTSGPTEDMIPVWSRDGHRVFFSSNRNGNFDVYSRAADGSTVDRVEFAGPGTQFPVAFTPDGRRLTVVEDFKDASVLDLARPDHLEPVFHGDFDVWLQAVSPDGNWIAYESNESGTQVEIYLRPFPNVSERREKISIDGGRFPLWGPTGSHELYYMNLKGSMMAASVTLSPSLSLGGVTKLFDWEPQVPGVSGMVYDISPLDGRFLMIKRDGSDGPINISVVLNWFTDLRERVPLRPR
ncbi:MAG: protein kinase [Vicinamibacterales bacterium]